MLKKKGKSNHSSFTWEEFRGSKKGACLLGLIRLGTFTSSPDGDWKAGSAQLSFLSIAATEKKKSSGNP